MGPLVMGTEEEGRPQDVVCTGNEPGRLVLEELREN